MPRYTIDCRGNNDIGCTMTFSSDDVDHLLEAVMPHATGFHKYPDGDETRQNLRSMMTQA